MVPNIFVPAAASRSLSHRTVVARAMKLSTPQPVPGVMSSSAARPVRGRAVAYPGSGAAGSGAGSDMIAPSLSIRRANFRLDRWAWHDRGGGRVCPDAHGESGAVLLCRRMAVRPHGRRGAGIGRYRGEGDHRQENPCDGGGECGGAADQDPEFHRSRRGGPDSLGLTGTRRCPPNGHGNSGRTVCSGAFRIHGCDPRFIPVLHHCRRSSTAGTDFVLPFRGVPGTAVPLRRRPGNIRARCCRAVHRSWAG
jgi:hypothetical protein